MQQCSALSSIPALCTRDTAIPHLGYYMREAIHCNQAKAASPKAAVSSVLASRAIPTKHQALDIEWSFIGNIRNKKPIIACLHRFVAQCQRARWRLQVGNASEPESGKVFHLCLSLCSKL